MRKICCATYFTEGWCYAIESWLEHFASAVQGFTGTLILSTDETEICREKAVHIAERISLLGWSCKQVTTKIAGDKEKAYDTSAQSIIAKIQNKAFSEARLLQADYFWSVESDILVPPNALKVLLQSLEFDDGYYGVAMVTYSNGQFLGGRGTPTRNICEDVDIEERIVPKALMQRHEKLKKEFEDASAKRIEPSKEIRERAEQLDKELKACPQKGNVFSLNAKKWKKRGWMDSAYPAVGRGAILPTDWVGLGCTLMNKKALSLATFEGYENKGTQDLFLCWNRWHPADIKMCVIPHILCHHVKRKVDKNGNRTDDIYVAHAYHEMEGECVGHLRVRYTDYYNLC